MSAASCAESTSSAPPPPTPPSPECEEETSQASAPPQDVEHEDVEPHISDESGTPLEASFVMDTCSATTPVDNTPLSTIKSTLVENTSTPVSTLKGCKGCTRYQGRCHNLQRANDRLRLKVSKLQKKVASQKETIKELEKVRH